MGKSRKDDWERPRNTGQHLTPDEVRVIRDGFAAKRKPSDIARELKCASRTVYAHFAVLKGAPRKYYVRKRRAKQLAGSESSVGATAPARAATPSRFYKSDFVPS